jgi:hypothetical protein
MAGFTPEEREIGGKWTVEEIDWQEKRRRAKRSENTATIRVYPVRVIPEVFVFTFASTFQIGSKFIPP